MSFLSDKEISIRHKVPLDKVKYLADYYTHNRGRMPKGDSSKKRINKDSLRSYCLKYGFEKANLKYGVTIYKLRELFELNFHRRPLAYSNS